MKDNKNKIGIYRWVNTINNKTYIGSAVSLIFFLLRFHLNKKKYSTQEIDYTDITIKKILKEIILCLFVELFLNMVIRILI